MNSTLVDRKMGYKSLITLMCLLAVIYRAQANPKTTYKSAVVTLSADREGGKVKNPTVEQLAKMVEENIRKFEKFIDLAGGQKVDILVFPEAMLNYDVMPDNNVTTGQFAVEVPGVEKRIAPCDEPTYKEVRLQNTALHYEWRSFIMISFYLFSRFCLGYVKL